MEILHRRALPHVEEDLPELLSHLEQGMQSTSVRRVAESSQVVFLELSLLPCASVFSVSQSEAVAACLSEQDQTHEASISVVMSVSSFCTVVAKLGPRVISYRVCFLNKQIPHREWSCVRQARPSTYRAVINFRFLSSASNFSPSGCVWVSLMVSS